MDYRELFDKKFMRVHREIDALRAEILLKKTGLIFTRHVYSQTELLDSNRFKKINSVCRKVGDDVLNWRQNGELPDNGIEEYRMARDKIARRLRAVNQAIVNREPTNLEKWLSLFSSVTRFILRHLPTVMRLLKIFMLLPKPVDVLSLPKPKDED